MAEYQLSARSERGQARQVSGQNSDPSVLYLHRHSGMPALQRCMSGSRPLMDHLVPWAWSTLCMGSAGCRSAVDAGATRSPDAPSGASRIGDPPVRGRQPWGLPGRCCALRAIDLPISLPVDSRFRELLLLLQFPAICSPLSDPVSPPSAARDVNNPAWCRFREPCLGKALQRSRTGHGQRLWLDRVGWQMLSSLDRLL